MTIVKQAAALQPWETHRRLPEPSNYSQVEFNYGTGGQNCKRVSDKGRSEISE